MRTPRDLSAEELIQLLKKLGYYIVRQKGSHIRLTTNEPFEHSITIPNHNPLKVGTLNSILNDVAAHLGITKEELVNRFW